jgi:hypothetical protein
MATAKALVLIVVLAIGLPTLAVAQSGKQVRVSFDFSPVEHPESGCRRRRRTRHHHGPRCALVGKRRRRQHAAPGAVVDRYFTIVQDGGESTMLVASQVPYPQVTFYRDYLTGAGYVASGVQFRDVGTSLKVRAAILPGNQVRVRLTPTVSWFSPDGSGVIEVNEARPSSWCQAAGRSCWAVRPLRPTS